MRADRPKIVPPRIWPERRQALPSHVNRFRISVRHSPLRTHNARKYGGRDARAGGHHHRPLRYMSCVRAGRRVIESFTIIRERAPPSAVTVFVRVNHGRPSHVYRVSIWPQALQRQQHQHRSNVRSRWWSLQCVRVRACATLI